MQVINGSEFEQKNVLVGQAGKTKGFGVTNDPVLMSMLSTGLYQNPLRTMIQEIMFNAWDAHRMGNCQDKPIDIYINDTSGLIVRDYGPGIEPEQLHPIYCIYGNSTKRQNAELTGGFGLGSKSPYAYTDSFTVTNHFEKEKYMYIMNRASDDNDGGPGMTPIIEGAPTDQTGLLVTVPLKEEDRQRAKQYIHDLTYLSGIKANLHFEDDEPELIESKSVAPGEWIFDDESTGRIYAVYGGVRYRLIDDHAYTNEFHFIQKMAKLMGNIYIGFKAGSLQPLPSREGLNLNEKTTESIRAQFERIEDSIKDMLRPAARVALKECLKSLAASDIQPHFVAARWDSSGNLSKKIDENHPVRSVCYEACPADVAQTMWNSLINVTIDRTNEIENLIGAKAFAQMQYVVWCKQFPDYKHYKSFMIGAGYSNIEHKTLGQIERPIWAKSMIEAKKIADQASDQDVDIRLCDSRDAWQVYTNKRPLLHRDRSRKEREVLEVLAKNDDLPPRKPSPDTLYRKKDGKVHDQIMMHGVIIVAQTLGALKDTTWNWQAMFSPQYGTVGRYHNFHRIHFNDYMSNDRLVGALVIHKKKSGYDAAVKALKDAGWEVLEADLPQPKARPVAADGTPQPIQKRGPITYPLYDPTQYGWAGEETEKPTCYVNVTEHMIRNNYSSDLPDKHLLRWIDNNTPRLVVVHSKSRLPRLEKMKIPSFEDKLHQMVEKIVSDEDRFRKLALHKMVRDECCLPNTLISLPEVSKFLGIPYLRTKQKETFERDLNMLDRIVTIYRNNWIKYQTQSLIRDSFRAIHEEPFASSVRETLKKTELFDGRKVQNLVQNMKPGERKVFSEKLMRFLRTV